MSRSIHVTRRTLAELRKSHFADRAEKAQLLREARKKLWRKRRIKAQIFDERHESKRPLAETDPSTIPIEVIDESTYVHYPLSTDDIRSLLMALPSAATEGISRVQLLLGKEYMAEKLDGEPEKPDPFTGRDRYEVLPGIYSAPVLGTYFSGDGHIALYAYVYDSGSILRLPVPEPAVYAYLRLQMLSTLLHEVAHHHDQIERVARGRWLSDRKETFESYAEKMEYDWTHEIGIPWLENRFPLEIRALTKWIGEYGGCRLPLSFLIEDPRRTDRRRGYSTLKPGPIFEYFVEELVEKPPAGPSCDTWLTFAWELHYADHYDRCLELLNRILAKEPDRVDAIICKADTLVHLDRLDEAWALAQSVLDREEADVRAYEIHADILEIREQWHELLAVCSRWKSVIKEGTDLGRDLPLYFAVACCALGQWDEMNAWIASRVRDGDETQLKRIRVRVFRRAGRELPGQGA